MVTKKEETEVVDVWAGPSGSTAPVIVQTAEGKITVTLKAGGGFEVPWIVRHANTVAEAVEFMQDPQLDELMDLTARKAKEFAKAFGGPALAAKPSGGSSWGGKAPAASNATQDTPTGVCSVHNCDLVKADAFTKRDGTKVNARVGCPVPKCYSDTVWQNDDGSWGKK